MENNEEILEGKKEEETSTSSVPDLSNSPVPTEEEIKDANVTEDVVADAVSDDSAVPEEPEVHEENGVTDLGKSFTQNQVNEMIGNTRTETRERTFRYIYDRYGVNNEEELDELFGNAQRFDSLKEQYDGDKKSWKDNDVAKDTELSNIKEQVALLQSGIDNARYDDAKFILKGKGLEITAENIANELASHPEWQKKEIEPVKPAEPESKISVLGNENANSGNSEVENEEDYAMKRYFKV